MGYGEYVVVFNNERRKTFSVDDHYLSYDEDYLAVFHDARTDNEDDDEIVLLIPYNHLNYVEVI